MSERPRGPWDFDEPPPRAQRAPARGWLWLLLLAGLGAVVAALFRSFPEAIQTPKDWSDLAWALALILLLTTGVFRLGRGAIAQHLRYAAIWTALVGALALGYAYRDTLARVPQRLQLAFGTGYPIPTAEHQVIVPQDETGAFILNAKVNGRPVRFIVDTGATDTVLSPAAAQRLGVDLDKVDFKESAETANGMGYGAPFSAQRLDVGPIAFANFPMVINQAPMTSSLLGLTFLNRLESFEIRDRKLILKWREPAPAKTAAATKPAAKPAAPAAQAPPPAAAPAKPSKSKPS
jgi:aspartyl protease family protein